MTGEACERLGIDPRRFDLPQEFRTASRRLSVNQKQQGKVERWKGAIKVIHAEAEDMVVRRMVWDELVEIIGDNPNIQKPSVFYEWLPVVYTHTQAISIRRMADQKATGPTLGKLIATIRENRTTAEAFAAADPLVFQDGSRMDKIVPNFDKDFDRLVDVTAPVKKYVDKRIAHLDADAARQILRFGDITKAIKVIEELTVNYYSFLFNKHLLVEPVLAYPWQDIFTLPWIKPRQYPSNRSE